MEEEMAAEEVSKEAEDKAEVTNRAMEVASKTEEEDMVDMETIRMGVATTTGEEKQDSGPDSLEEDV